MLNPGYFLIGLLTVYGKTLRKTGFAVYEDFAGCRYCTYCMQRELIKPLLTSEAKYSITGLLI